ncbi:MAG: ATP-binding cassette domain-containing protein, partial [bacterium]|nr:ATP-binding cassette domain-containing protein [bacterium]
MNLCIQNIEVVSKDHRKILDQFSLDIGSGEVHVIMGPNGTGKSTLSKVIMGSHDYSVVSGDILYNDESILDKDIDER